MAGPPRLVRKTSSGSIQVVKEIAKIPEPVKLEPPKADFVSGGTGSWVIFGAEGFEALQNNLLKLPKYAMNAAGCEMENILADVLVESLTECPEESGALKRSGKHDHYIDKSALIKAPMLMEMKIWYGAPPATTQSTEGAYVQTVDIEGNIIESGVKIGHQTTGVMRISREVAAKEGMGSVEEEKDPSKYAWKQHEHLEYKHPLGGKAKFLEDPWNRAVPTMVGRIRKAVGISFDVGDVFNLGDRMTGG